MPVKPRKKHMKRASESIKDIPSWKLSYILTGSDTSSKAILELSKKENISPMEIENILITHPKVLNAAVVPMPDPVMGEKACAYIILREGRRFTFNEMVSYLEGKKIAPYKLPERLEIVDSFPMAGDGQKVLKRQLAEEISSKLEAEGKI